jgi:AcrR family transcriptional regulator
VARPKKNAQPALDQASIKAVAWQQISESGLSMLSLRGIARAMGISAPAIYHYFADRDALVTALTVDAYESLRTTLINAYETLPPHYLEGRLRANLHAYRDWAIAHPNHYNLLFGPPLNGYEIPLDIILPEAAKTLAVLVSIVDAIYVAGRLNPSSVPPFTDPPPPAFAEWTVVTGLGNFRSLVTAQSMWARMHGLVSAEITLNMPPVGMRYRFIYAHTVDQIVAEHLLRA